MNKILIILILIVSICFSQTDGHYAPCLGLDEDHANNSAGQNCYGYATHRVLGHYADYWCDGTTIVRETIGPWFNKTEEANYNSIKSTVETNNLVEWSGHVVQVSGSWYWPPNLYAVEVNERVVPIKTQILIMILTMYMIA